MLSRELSLQKPSASHTEARARRIHAVLSGAFTSDFSPRFKLKILGLDAVRH